MNQNDIAKEVLAVSLHIAEASNFDLEETKKRMQQLTESVLKTSNCNYQSDLLRKNQNKHSNQTVDLEFQQIDNLKDLLPHLANCSNLRELILHGNRLHTLPEDLSILTTVETLDISNNLFDDIIPIVKALKTMPKLIHLHIGIRNQKEETYIIQQLVNLITLNNKRIRFFDQLDSERISERQSARSDRQQGVEVSFNQDDIGNVEMLYEQICNLDNSKAQSTEQNNQLVEHVKLVMTDFQNKVGQTHSKHFLDTHILKAKYDLYEICFRELIEYFRSNNNTLEKVLQGIQIEHSNIFNDLTNIIYTLRDYKKIQKENQQIESLLQDTQLVQQLRQEISGYQNSYLQIQQDLQLTQNSKEQLLQQISYQQHQITNLQNSVSVAFQEKDTIQGQLQQLEFQLAQVKAVERSHQTSQKQMLSANQSFQDLQSFSYLQTQQVVMLVKSTQTQIPNICEKECQTVDLEETVNQTKSVDLQSFQQELEELQSQNEQLQLENKKYLELIIKRSKGDKTSNFNSEVYFTQTESPSMIEKKRIKSINEFKLLVQPQSFRPLSLKQLKDCINDIFESKQKHDLRQLENRLPLETIEQHMYTYLNCKYGLKNLALEWAACIINAIQKHLSEDNDIAVFALMLKNQIDEDFRKTQNESKQIVEQLLKVLFKHNKIHLQCKYKTKHVAEIKEMVKQKVNGLINESEILDILQQIYSQEEKEMIMSQLKQYQSRIMSSVSPVKLSSVKKDQLRRSSTQKNQISYEYSAFIKLILEYQMLQRENYLSCYVTIFKEVDIDKDGIINEVQFRKITQTIYPELTQEEYFKIYNILDPNMNNSITFSQIASLFSDSSIIGRESELMSQIKLM